MIRKNTYRIKLINYTAECDKCKKIIEMTGGDTEAESMKAALRRGAVEYNEKLYCKKCASKFKR